MKRGSLTESHIINPSFQNPKQSRLYVKQQEIKKKLSKVQSLEQLQKIYNAMKSQNLQLARDLKVLKQNLAQVQEKKKIQSSTISTKSESAVSMLIEKDLDLSQYSPEQVVEYQRNKKQLEQQYKLMRYLKNSIAQVLKQTPTQQVTEQKLNKKNKLKQIEAEIETQKQKRKLLTKEADQLQQTVKANEASDNINSVSIANFERQNQELRKKILQFKQQGYKHESKAAHVIDQIYKKKQMLTQFRQTSNSTLLTLKTKQQNSSDSQFLKRSKSISNNFTEAHSILKKPIRTDTKTPLIQSLSDPKPINNEELNTQIADLKQKVHQLSIQEIKRKQLQKKKKQDLIEDTRKLNDKLKDIQKIKTKKLVEYNHLKATIKNFIKKKQFKQKLQGHTTNFCIQEDGFQLQFISDPLRRDFAGILGQKVWFDDRMYLKEKKREFIKGLIVYENDNNLSAKGSIVAIRAIYTDQQTNQLNAVPILGQYLQKCKTQRLELPEDDFLKLIKVKYNTKQTRVSKIEIRSNRNRKYEFGEKKPFQEVLQHETVYAFDIGLNQFPVSMFGSICHLRNCWYLQSLGVQINSLT